MALNTSNQNNSLIKSVTDAIYDSRESLLPIFAITAFGGTAIYLIYSGRTRAQRGAQASNNELKRSRPSRGSSDDSVTEVVLADLPPETRSKIWEKLDYKDLIKLRLVAGFTKDDVENWVGVKIRISSTRLPEQYEFCQRVALQSCIIHDLSQDVDQDFFFNPSIMTYIEVIEKSPIDLNRLVNLLVTCSNLRKLQLHFLYSINHREISDNILHSIQYMQHLKILKLFRISVHSPTFKSIIPIPKLGTSKFVTMPTKLTEVEIEISDVPEPQVAVWKYVLEKQTHLKILVINVGAVHWKFVQKIIPKNPNLERISLEGFCNLNNNTRSSNTPAEETVEETREPFDWRIFENCINLKSFEIGCPPIIDSEEHESMASINFKFFPCGNIEEFYVYKVLLAPDDVRRVYTEMKKMSSGSLNGIGQAGTEAAAEMFWIHAQHLQTHQGEWTEGERWLDIVANSALGCVILAIVFVISRHHGGVGGGGEVIEDDAFQMWRAHDPQ